MESLAQIKRLAVEHYFDKVMFRTARALSESEESFLRNNATSLTRQHGWWNVVNLNDRGLSFFVKLPHLTIYELEIARDDIVEDQDQALWLRDLFDTHFVHSWHGKHEIVVAENGVYTGQRRPGKRFGWYGDRPCKRTGELHCFHLEGRHIGTRALKRIGINHPRDLLTFDHAAYWQRHLKLYRVDLERLGRFHMNRRSGGRRQRPRHGFYNLDRSTGSIIFRNLAQHDDLPLRSAQLFVDRYGRGPFLHPIRYIGVYVDKSFLLSETRMNIEQPAFVHHQNQPVSSIDISTT
jgi:hypothetical protein